MNAIPMTPQPGGPEFGPLINPSQFAAGMLEFLGRADIKGVEANAMAELQGIMQAIGSGQLEVNYVAVREELLALRARVHDLEAQLPVAEEPAKKG